KDKDKAKAKDKDKDVAKETGAKAGAKVVKGVKQAPVDQQPAAEKKAKPAKAPKQLTKAQARRQKARAEDAEAEAQEAAEKANPPRKPKKVKPGSALVVVESPAQARTIGKYLGAGYVVKASVGHIRDLPKSKIGIDFD